jgi:membrane-bound ClpP family serine protease
MKPRDWLDLVVGVAMLVLAFLGVTRLLPMPWWFVLALSLGYVLLVGGVMVRVRGRALR